MESRNQYLTVLRERYLKTKAKKEKTQILHEAEKKGATLEELRPMISVSRMRQAMEEGDINAGIISCGEAVGLIHDIPTVKELIDRMVGEAKAISQRLHNLGIGG